MLVKITDFPDDLIENLKLATGQNTASKAVFVAASQFVATCEESNEFAYRCQELEHEVQRLNRIISGARDACALVVEQFGQGDIFSLETPNASHV